VVICGNSWNSWAVVKSDRMMKIRGIRDQEKRKSGNEEAGKRG
jgi:hypothetical protein